MTDLDLYLEDKLMNIQDERSYYNFLQLCQELHELENDVQIQQELNDSIEYQLPF